MKVEAHPLEDDRFGPKDEGGQRGDMFKNGGLIDKLKKYNHGGAVEPRAPELILNDPMFQGVRYVGKAKDDYVRKVGGQGADFRVDAAGLKFYGYNDDGLYIEDKDGNLFVAERTGRVPGDPAIKKRLQDPSLTGSEKMRLLAELEDSRLETCSLTFDKNTVASTATSMILRSTALLMKIPVGLLLWIQRISATTWTCSEAVMQAGRSSLDLAKKKDVENHVNTTKELTMA